MSTASAGDPGMFFFLGTASLFKEGQMRIMSCRWCGLDLPLQYPLRLFMCPKCDRPGAGKEFIPDA